MCRRRRHPRIPVVEDVVKGILVGGGGLIVVVGGVPVVEDVAVALLELSLRGAPLVTWLGLGLARVRVRVRGIGLGLRLGSRLGCHFRSRQRRSRPTSARRGG